MTPILHSLGYALATWIISFMFLAWTVSTRTELVEGDFTYISIMALFPAAAVFLITL